MGVSSERGTDADEGYERLYQAILSGEFQPNERLVETLRTLTGSRRLPLR